MSSYYDEHIDRCRHDYEEIKREIEPLKNISFHVVASSGDVPEKYLITYHLKSIERADTLGNPVFRYDHRVSISLHLHYPRLKPLIHWETPIWHPNIHHVEGEVCVSEWAADRTLTDLVLYMANMVIYKHFFDELKDQQPLDGPAAEWSRAYRKGHPDAFPLCSPDVVFQKKDDGGLVVVVLDESGGPVAPPEDGVTIRVINDGPLPGDSQPIVVRITDG